MSIRDFVTEITAAHLRRHGIEPGRRHAGDDPQLTYQSDLVEAEVERIMGSREDLADVLQTATEMLLPRPVAELLAYITAHWWSESDAVTALSRASHDAVKEKVIAHVRAEAGL